MWFVYGKMAWKEDAVFTKGLVGNIVIQKNLIYSIVKFLEEAPEKHDKGLTIEHLKQHGNVQKKCQLVGSVKISKVGMWLHGFYLELEKAEIMAIRKNNSTEEAKRICTLTKWKEKKGSGATYYNLIAIHVPYHVQPLPLHTVFFLCCIMCVATQILDRENGLETPI